MKAPAQTETFCQRVVAAAGIRPQKVAMSVIEREGQKTITFGSMLSQIRSIAYRLTQEKIAFGDRVAILGENHPNWAIAYLGIIYRGLLPSAISASCALRLLRRPVIRDGLQLKDGGFSCVLPTDVCRKLDADFVIASDVWEWSSLMRSLGCSPSEPRWIAQAYPSHYRFALARTDIHIHPTIPATGYVPGAAAVDRMIAVGERTAYMALESFSRIQAA